MMDSATRHCLLSYLEDIKERYDAGQIRMAQLGDYDSKRLKIICDKDGREYYSVFVPERNRFIYAGTATNEEVLKIKEAHFHKRMNSELFREIRITEKYLRMSKDVGFSEIDNKLKKAYKGACIQGITHNSSSAGEWKNSMEQYKKTFPPFMPEELIHRTRDGAHVRSKGEALIYNYLLELGITFVYELPLHIRYNGKNSLLLPDFTILSEIDFESTIFIEHQGLMNDHRYRTKFNESVYKYWLNDYLPERDVFFTFDLQNGGFDDTPVRNIIRRSVRPTV